MVPVWILYTRALSAGVSTESSELGGGGKHIYDIDDEHHNFPFYIAYIFLLRRIFMMSYNVHQESILNA